METDSDVVLFLRELETATREWRVAWAEHEQPEPRARPEAVQPSEDHKALTCELGVRYQARLEIMQDTSFEPLGMSLYPALSLWYRGRRVFQTDWRQMKSEQLAEEPGKFFASLWELALSNAHGPTAHLRAALAILKQL